jgi:hypothetical protein
MCGGSFAEFGDRCVRTLVERADPESARAGVVRDQLVFDLGILGGHFVSGFHIGFVEENLRVFVLGLFPLRDDVPEQAVNAAL